MKKVAALVVTYNRKEKLLKNINSLLKQTYKLEKIYIIDNNSTDNTYDYIKKVLDKNKQIIYIKLEENTGGSGGFSYGLKTILDSSKCDFVWGMDDDAYPEADALEKIMNIRKDGNCYWSNPDHDNDGYTNGIKEVNGWMFVGFFIPLEIIKEVGISKPDYFIYHDDLEYAYRIIKAGYKIYKIKDSVIVHDNGITDCSELHKKFLGKNISIIKLSNWKMYYFVRNSILMYKFSDIKRYKYALYVMPKLLIRILIVNRKQFGIAFKGYIHGIFNISGKRVSP